MFISGVTSPVYRLHYTEFNTRDLEHVTDPDNHFYFDINTMCEYYTDEQIKNYIV